MSGPSRISWYSLIRRARDHSSITRFPGQYVKSASRLLPSIRVLPEYATCAATLTANRFVPARVALPSFPVGQGGPLTWHFTDVIYALADEGLTRNRRG